MAHGHQAGNLAIDPELNFRNPSQSETSLIDRNFFHECAFDFNSNSLLIDRPNSWSDKLKEMPIWVAKVDARATRRPVESALNGNIPLSEACLPGRQTLRRDAKANVRRAICAMRRNCSKGQRRPLRIAAANEEKQHLPPADAESAETVVRLHHRVTKKAGVEVA